MYIQETLEKKIINKYSKLVEKNISPYNTLSVLPTNLIKFMYFMKNDKDLAFDILCDHTAVDWIDKNTFDLIYNLYSTVHNHQFIVITTISRKTPIISTLSNIWKIAEWQEREVYDFFGILYKKHPDLRRLFLEDDWIGFPLRKDYKDNFMLEME
jgi:NADH/F420H2 dehydrogenase subunit C